MLKGVLLDIDGTLLLSNNAHAQAWVDAFKEYGYDVAFEKVFPLIGMGSDKVIATVLPDLNDEKKGTEISSRRGEIFMERYTAELKPTPGARELVQKIIESGMKPVIATSATTQELDTLVKAAKIDDLIPTKTTSDDAKESKPAPDIIEAALAKGELPASSVVMIGDSPFDVESAGKAGVPVIAVRTGGHPDEKLRGAVAIYDDPAEILKHWTSSPLCPQEAATVASGQ